VIYDQPADNRHHFLIHSTLITPLPHLCQVMVNYVGEKASAIKLPSGIKFPT